MKFAVLLAFAALQEVSLTKDFQVLHTGAQKTVPELIAFYESLVGRLVPDNLFHRRHAHRPGAGGQKLTNNAMAGGLWSVDRSDAGGSAHTFDSVGGWSSEILIGKGLKPRDGYIDGGLLPTHDRVGGDLGRHYDSAVGSLAHTYDSVGGNHGSFSGFVSGGRKSYDIPPTGGIGHNYGSLGDGLESTNGFVAGGLGLQYGSSAGGQGSIHGLAAGGLAHSYDSVLGGPMSSVGSVTGGRKTHDGSSTGGLAHTYGSIDGGLESTDGFVAGGHGLLDGSVPGGQGSTQGSAAGSPRFFTDYSLGESLESTNGLTAKGQVPTDYYLADSKVRSDDEYSVPTGADYATYESSEAAGLSPGMKEGIHHVRLAYMLALSPKYDGMSNRRLWKVLFRKQRELEKLKLQLQHLMYIKREKLRKLHGIPWQYWVPSKALSTSIIRDLEEIVSYRPPEYLRSF